MRHGFAVTDDPRYLQYFRLFREEKYFEAHEILESLWLETKGEQRVFYQGLIQLAAALVHFQKGNLDGARELVQNASKHFLPYLPKYGGVEISLILKEFEKFLAEWSKNPSQPLRAKKFIPQPDLKP